MAKHECEWGGMNYCDGFSKHFVDKLDGVGPIDNRPSVDKLQHFVKKKEKNYLRHVSRDM